MIKFKKKNRCPMCKEKIKDNDVLAELRLETLEGEHVMMICNTCADFLDKSAEILTKRHREDD